MMAYTFRSSSVSRRGLNTTGLLFVGDCKMSALDTRAYLARHQHLYLSPLPLTGATAEAMDDLDHRGGGARRGGRAGTDFPHQ